MKTRLLLVLVILGTGWTTVWATYGGGDGTVETPYQIWTPEQMNAIGENPDDWGANFKLMADLDMSSYTGTQYNIIGNITNRFTGTFDGNGHVIRNLTYETTASRNHVGLFGVIDSAAIQDLGVENVQISTGGNFVGGLVGSNLGTLLFCHADVSVSGGSYVGGLVGYNPGTLSSSFATGSVSGSGGFVGGLVGYNSGTLTTCYATGPVSAISNVGGLVGYNESGILTTCYAAGSVSGSSGSGVGGLVGWTNTNTFTSCFWDIQSSGTTGGVGNDPDPVGVAGKMTSEMKTLSTFTDAGWDFIESDSDPADWCMPYRDYPGLAWQYPGGGGSGTADNPYRIWTPAQMNTIGMHTSDWGANFKLMADLDMSAYTGTQYNIIGKIIGSTIFRFTGTFDGNGHVIRNLTYETTASRNYVGLFGVIYNATIRNLGVKNVQLSTGGDYVGGLCGRNEGTITSCYVTGTVNGSFYIGGLVGKNTYTYLGGLDFVSGRIGSCYAIGDVNGNSYVGGLVGQNRSVVRTSYFTGSVNGSGGFVGGLFGSDTYGTASCFWDKEVSGIVNATGGGIIGYTAGKTTVEMKTASTFASAGWDFVNVWDIVNLQTYPLLRAFSGGVNPADINYSGTVDLEDLAILAANWLQ